TDKNYFELTLSLLNSKNPVLLNFPKITKLEKLSTFDFRNIAKREKLITFDFRNITVQEKPGTFDFRNITERK
ncbi:MAG TPA: hypothetical protein PLN75_09550, partial [Paludibacteraceae bacterium]|nr:hypothetical protein [Paludibacteraceae bacterium]